jgi:hypothetical protein
MQAERTGTTSDAQPSDAQPSVLPAPRRLARPVTVISGAAALGLIAWFLFAWLQLGHDIADAAGESIGSALLMLLAVSMAGVARRHRR